MWRTLAVFCLLAALCSAWLEIGDRRSVAALYLIEWGSVLRVPVYVALAIAGSVLLLLSPRKPKLRSNRRRASKTRPQRQGEPKTRLEFGPPSGDSSEEWLVEIRDAAQKIKFDAGARLVLDTQQAFPITLTLEQMTPERIRRAVTQFGSWMSKFPPPPRVKVVFVHCPASTGPRHHRVGGALAVAIPRSDFHVVSHQDEVDVVFHHPGAMWLSGERRPDLDD